MRHFQSNNTFRVKSSVLILYFIVADVIKDVNFEKIGISVVTTDKTVNIY